MKALPEMMSVQMVVGLFMAMSGEASAAERFTVFGLEHSLLTNTVLNTTSASPLRVENASLICPDDNCEIQERFGVTVHLGEADSGLFAYPDDADALLEVETDFSGYLLEGYAYGSVDGVTNRPISSLSVTRTGWGQYAMSVDFSAVGATNYTYEVLSDGRRTLYTTNQGSCSAISTYDIEPGVPPRANPFWRMDDGFGAVIELPGVTRIYTCDGASGVGQRLVIRAVGATSRVDHVSHVSIVGSEGLPRFAIEDERIGMFGLAHRALGGVMLSTTNRELTFRSVPEETEQSDEGVMIEVPRGLQWDGEFRPLSLSNDNSSLLISAEGTSSTNRGGAYYGPAGVSRMNGAGRLLADFSGLSATGVVVEVFLRGVPGGSLVVSGTTNLGLLAVTNPTVLRCRATGRDGAAAASFSFTLAEATTFRSITGGELTGDEFRLSPAAAGEFVGTLNHVVLHKTEVGQVTLIHESAKVGPVPVMALDIERAGAGVIISWPVTGNFFLRAKTELNSGAWSYTGLSKYLYGDFRFQVVLPDLTNSMRFFQLTHAYNHYIYPAKE